MRIALPLIAALLFLAPGIAQAYVGPGLGLGAIGAILGVIFSVILAILAFLVSHQTALWHRQEKAGRPGR